MAARKLGSRSFKHVVNCDLELRPLMNVFIVLIPMLLMSAVFVEIRVIDMTLPSAVEAAPAAAAVPLELAIRIRRNEYVVVANGLAPVSIDRRAALGGLKLPDPAATMQLEAVLQKIVAARPDNKDVRIVAESSTRYQEIINLMDVARGAGLPQASLEGSVTEGV